MDGSALDFAQLLDEAGTVDQDAEVTEAVICEKLSIGEEDPEQKYLYVEPYDGFEVTMRVNYPPPILEQQLTFNAEQDSFLNEIAPARSFNTFQNIDMAQKMGKTKKVKTTEECSEMCDEKKKCKGFHFQDPKGKKKKAGALSSAMGFPIGNSPGAGHSTPGTLGSWDMASMGGGLDEEDTDEEDVGDSFSMGGAAPPTS